MDALIVATAAAAERGEAGECPAVSSDARYGVTGFFSDQQSAGPHGDQPRERSSGSRAWPSWGVPGSELSPHAHGFVGGFVATADGLLGPVHLSPTANRSSSRA